MTTPVDPSRMLLKPSDGGMQLIWSSRDLGLISNGKLTSMIDLPQTTMILTGRLLDTMQMTEFALYSKSGRARRGTGPFDRFRVTHQPFALLISVTEPGLRYVFPPEPQ